MDVKNIPYPEIFVNESKLEQTDIGCDSGININEKMRTTDSDTELIESDHDNKCDKLTGFFKKYDSSKFNSKKSDDGSAPTKMKNKKLIIIIVAIVVATITTVGLIIGLAPESDNKITYINNSEKTNIHHGKGQEELIIIDVIDNIDDHDENHDYNHHIDGQKHETSPQPKNTPLLDENSTSLIDDNGTNGNEGNQTSKIGERSNDTTTKMPSPKIDKDTQGDSGVKEVPIKIKTEDPIKPHPSQAKVKPVNTGETPVSPKVKPTGDSGVKEVPIKIKTEDPIKPIQNPEAPIIPIRPKVKKDDKKIPTDNNGNPLVRKHKYVLKKDPAKFDLCLDKCLNPENSANRYDYEKKNKIRSDQMFDIKWDEFIYKRTYGNSFVQKKPIEFNYIDLELGDIGSSISKVSPSLNTSQYYSSKKDSQILRVNYYDDNPLVESTEKLEYLTVLEETFSKVKLLTIVATHNPHEGVKLDDRQRRYIQFKFEVSEDKTVKPPVVTQDVMKTVILVMNSIFK